jgi:hypothetical protein
LVVLAASAISYGTAAEASDSSGRSTLYNAEHFFHPKDLKRYSLGTKNKSLSMPARNRPARTGEQLTARSERLHPGLLG